MSGPEGVGGFGSALQHTAAGLWSALVDRFIAVWVPGGYHRPAAVCLLLQPPRSLLLRHVQAERAMRLKITCFKCGVGVASDLPPAGKEKSWFFSMVCVVCLSLSFLSEMILHKLWLRGCLKCNLCTGR